MRLLLLADLHITNTRPKWRIDKNYLKSCIDKLNYAITYAIKNKIKTILIAGDLTDSASINNTVIQRIIKVMKRAYHENIKIYSVRGQHDMLFHSKDITNIPMWIFHEAEILTVLNQNEYIPLDDDTVLYGCSWNEEIPVPADETKFNILVIHKMISNNDYWKGNIKFTNAGSFLTKHKFDLIVSGDNHNPFYFKLLNRIIVNPGSMMRKNIDQINYQPGFFIYDSYMKTLQQEFFPIKSIETSFNIKEIKKYKELEIGIEGFSNALKSKLKYHLKDFVPALKNFIEENKHEILPEIESTIWEFVNAKHNK